MSRNSQFLILLVLEVQFGPQNVQYGPWNVLISLDFWEAYRVPGY